VKPALLTALLLAAAHAAEPTWTAVLHPDDFVMGKDLPKLGAHRTWLATFTTDGQFEIAVRKSAVPVPAPGCRMAYLILRMPAYYPENPKQAPMAERKAVYDTLTTLKHSGKGSLKVHVEANGYSRKTPDGSELTTCNLYFVLPLDKDAAKILP
jgi:hypothetical protein